MKKVATIFFLLFLLVTTAAVVVVKGRGAERNLIGVWEKEGLDFERVNFEGHEIKSIILQAQENEISHDLIVDRINMWEFSRDNLKVINNTKKENNNLTWKLKGRGHILEITDNKTKSVESYQIQELSDDKLVVFANIDLQVRGIVKITFKKNKPNYAKKI